MAVNNKAIERKSFLSFASKMMSGIEERFAMDNGK